MDGLFPDEILWMDEHAETDAPRNLDRRDITVTFSDGSYLGLGARSQLPPLSEMTNELVEGFDREYVQHFNRARPHQGIEQKMPEEGRSKKSTGRSSPSQW